VIRSWLHQTLPARTATLEESAELHAELASDADPGLRDMALLGLIADAAQPLEDLAYLATAWDAPFTGVANYVRATTFSGRIPTNFWQSVPNWDDQRLDVIGGFSMRDPLNGTISDFLDLTGLADGLDPESLRVLEKAKARSREEASRIPDVAQQRLDSVPCLLPRPQARRTSAPSRRRRVCPRSRPQRSRDSLGGGLGPEGVRGPSLRR
jgi:hypothetical protein